MKKHITLLGLLIVSPITSWSYSRDYIDEMLNPQQASTAWTQDPKMIIVVALSIVVAARILWWTLDVFESSFNKPKKKNKDEPEKAPQIITSRDSDDGQRTEHHLASMQLMSNIGITGMSLSQQIDNKLTRHQDELANKIKQLLKEKLSPIQQQLENVSSKITIIEGRLGSLENKLEQLKTIQK